MGNSKQLLDQLSSQYLTSKSGEISNNITQNSVRFGAKFSFNMSNAFHNTVFTRIYRSFESSFDLASSLATIMLSELPDDEILATFSEEGIFDCQLLGFPQNSFLHHDFHIFVSVTRKFAVEA